MYPHLLNNVIKPIGLLAIAAIVAAFHQGCNPAKAPLDASYAAQTEKCALEAQSRSESHLCRANVNQAYGLCPSTVLPCPGDLK